MMKTLAVIIIMIMIIICFYNYNKSNNQSELEYYFRDGAIHDTIYFKVLDQYGKLSYIHDSGISPKSIKDGKIHLNIVKKEYNDGKVNEIGSPVEVKYGQEIRNLKTSAIIKPENVKDKDLYYTVTINI